MAVKKKSGTSAVPTSEGETRRPKQTRSPQERALSLAKQLRSLAGAAFGAGQIDLATAAKEAAERLDLKL